MAQVGFLLHGIFNVKKAGGFSNNSGKKYWKSLLLIMFELAAIFASVAKSLCLIESMREFRHRVLHGNTFHFVLNVTFFHRLPLIMQAKLYNFCIKQSLE